MDQSLRNIGNHMRELGLAALQHANWHSNYSSYENRWWSELSVLQAGHAAEILIKARIADEHPLLIFEQLPKPSDDVTLLGLKQLVEKAKAIQFSELPQRLWATTGIRLSNIEKYNSFSKLRNTIQHFAVPEDIDVSQQTIEFIFDVIDPFINQCWKLFAIDFNEDHEPYEYFVPGLMRREIRFLISPEIVERYDELPWSGEETQQIQWHPEGSFSS
jgi:hypothetical protein